MKIAKTFRLLRLSWLELRSKRIEQKKYRLTCIINKDLSSVDDEKLSQLNNLLEQLKGTFTCSYSGDENNDD